jgi:hypothetical protein
MSAKSVLYKPLDLVVGVIGGMIATAIFSRMWRQLSGEEEVPDPTSREHGWREVLLAAALQGAVFGGVRAAVGRASVMGLRRAAGRNRHKSST